MAGGRKGLNITGEIFYFESFITQDPIAAAGKLT